MAGERGDAAAVVDTVTVEEVMGEETAEGSGVAADELAAAAKAEAAVLVAAVGAGVAVAVVEQEEQAPCRQIRGA